MMDKLLSVEQVAEALGVTYKTALKVVNAMPHIKIGGKLLRVSESDLQRWIRSQTVQPSQAEPELPLPRKKRKHREDFRQYLDENGMIPSRKPKNIQTA